MPELLTPAEAAQYLGVDAETIRRAIRDGALPAQTTPGGHYRLRLADVSAYQVSRGTQATPLGAVTIAIVHHAGGVGKTTTTLNLGYELARAGRRVLLVDLDPQGDLSERLGIGPTAPPLAAVLLGRAPGPPERVPCAWEGAAGFDVIPASLDEMADLEVQLMSLQMREQRLARTLAPLRRQYDVVLLDCPPNLSLLTTNALWAADQVIVPVQTQDKALRQLPKILDSVGAVQEFREGPPALLGLLLTMADRRETMSGEVEEQLRAAYGAAVFDTVIPKRTRLAEDARWAAPAGVYSPANGAAYSGLAQEVLTRARA